MANCEYTQEKFKESRDTFKMMVEKAHSNDLEKMTSPDCSIAIEIAVSWAYNDAKRTMHGITKDDREEAEDAIVKEFKAYFTNSAPCEKKFKESHIRLCNAWINSFEGGSSLGTYGKAQKIVNMTFKYLYCCTNIDNFENHFKYCHMPLDSFTLEWCKRNIQEIDPNKIGSWSKMKDEKSDTYKESKNIEKYSYHYYVARIRDYVAINKIELTPLQLEFIIWPKMQLELATENYLFTLTDEYKKTSEKEKLRKESLEDKMALVVNTINNFNFKKQ